MQTSYSVFLRGKPLEKASKALILLHGRGGEAHEIMSLAELFCDDDFLIAALQAPHGAWYPASFMAEEADNEPALTNSLHEIKKLMDQIAEYIPKSRIYFMGFSQGACIALETTARHAVHYGGVVAFSGALIGNTGKKYKGNFEGTKIFIGLADQDPHIPLFRAQQSQIILDQMGATTTMQVYPGISHHINQDEIDWVKKNIF